MSLFFPFYFLFLHLRDLRVKLFERAAGLNGCCSVSPEFTWILISLVSMERLKGNILISKVWQLFTNDKISNAIILTART